MNNVESKIGNPKHALLDETMTEAIYLSDLDDKLQVDDNILPYGEKIIYQKEVDVDNDYIEAKQN